MTKRPTCPKCDYILVRCLCEFIAPIENKTHIIILQHPSEKKHALNTVHLMKKSFKNITVFTGEDFSQDIDFLNQLKNKNSVLVFPNKKPTSLELSETKMPDQIILLDGTWKKAKKIYYCSTILHSIPTIELMPSEETQYKIQTSSLKNSLSTLEASTLILKFIEPNLDTQSAITAFHKMIDFQIEKMGSEKYITFYKKKGDE